MKKILTILLLTFGVALVAQTIDQKKKETSKIILTKAPKQVAHKFANDYPDVKPSWTLVGDD